MIGNCESSVLNEAELAYYSLSFLLNKIFYELTLLTRFKAVLSTLLHVINSISSGMLLHSQDTAKLQSITTAIVKPQDQR